MQTEDFVFNNRCKRDVVKKISQHLPYVLTTIFSHTFVVKPINLSYLSAFVVSSQDCEPVWIPYFQNKQECDCFYRVVSSINVVSHKEVVGVWALTSVFEQFNQVVKLAMDVTTDSDRTTD